MLYLIRHGITEWNKIHKLQGRMDIPLAKEGREMARKACEQYKDINFDVVFCSPLVRAKETAEYILAGRNLPIIYDDRLMEICFGDYEGTECVFDMPDHLVYKFFKDPEHYVATANAEGFTELFARTENFLTERVDPLLAEGKDVLIVGHGAMNSSIICQKRGYALKDFWKEGIENCKLKAI
ncbi:MAG: histidine phosphatase family protein [Lachnospiraceae bacterium]